MPCVIFDPFLMRQHRYLRVRESLSTSSDQEEKRRTSLAVLVGSLLTLTGRSLFPTSETTEFMSSKCAVF